MTTRLLEPRIRPVFLPPKSDMAVLRAMMLLLGLSRATAWTVGLRPMRCSGRTAVVVCQDSRDATLLDPDSGKTLKCLVAGTVVVETPGAEDEVYGALYPADTPITLAQMEDDVLVPLMEADERALFSMAQRACLDINIELLDTPVLLTAGSGLDELLMDADDMADADDDADDDDEAEEAMVLTAFQHEVSSAAPTTPYYPCRHPCNNPNAAAPPHASTRHCRHCNAAGRRGVCDEAARPNGEAEPALTRGRACCDHCPDQMVRGSGPGPGLNPSIGPHHGCLFHHSSSLGSARATVASCCRRTRRSTRSARWSRSFCRISRKETGSTRWRLATHHHHKVHAS